MPGDALRGAVARTTAERVGSARSVGRLPNRLVARRTATLRNHRARQEYLGRGRVQPEVNGVASEGALYTSESRTTMSPRARRRSLRRSRRRLALVPWAKDPVHHG